MDTREAQLACLGWLEERRLGRKRQEQERDEEFLVLQRSGLLEAANPQPAMKKAKVAPPERGTASSWRGALGASPPGANQKGAKTGPSTKGNTGTSKDKTATVKSPDSQPKGKGNNKGKDKGKSKLDTVTPTAPTVPVVQGPHWTNLLNDTSLHCYMNIQTAFLAYRTPPIGRMTWIQALNG